MSAPRRAAPAWLAGATISEADGVRYLHLGTEWIQGAMRIGRPRAIELEYVQRMMAWMLWRPTPDVAAGRALQFGLGAAAITRFTHSVLKMPTTAVEINPSVAQACRLWFSLPADEPGRLAVEIADASRWAAEPAHRGAAAVLCVDLYDHEAAAPVLDDAAFYAGCRDVLDPDGGLMSVNLFGRDASFDASAARIAEAFGAERVWHLAPTKEGNAIVVAARGLDLPDRATLVARADAIESRWKLPARKWLKLIRPWRGAARGP